MGFAESSQKMVKEMRVFFGMFYLQDFWENLKIYLRLSSGTIICTTSLFFIQPVTVIFASPLKTMEFAAVGLACSIINMIMNSLIMGFSTACDNFLAQCYGSGNKANIGVIIQRSLLIHVPLVVITWCIFFNTEHLLLALNQNPQLAALCGHYLLVFSPGCLFMMLFQIQSKYLQCQDKVNIVAVIALICNIVHAGLQYLFIQVLNQGLFGSAVAQAICYVLMCFITFSYITITKLYKDTWTGWSINALQGWTTYTKMGIYGLLMNAFECVLHVLCEGSVMEWAFEIGIIFAGLISVKAVAAQTVVLTISSALAVPTSFGLGLAISIHISQLLGAGQFDKAKNATKVGFVITAMLSCITFTFFASTYYILPELFSDDSAVLKLTRRIILPYYAMYAATDNLACFGRRLFQSNDKQTLGTLAVFVSSYIIGLPIAIILMVWTDTGLAGFWIGTVIGIIILTGIMLAYIALKFDWEELSLKARERAGANDYKSTLSESSPLLKHKENTDSETTQDVIYRRLLFMEKGLIYFAFLVILIIGFVLGLSNSSMLRTELAVGSQFNFTTNYTTTRTL